MNFLNRIFAEKDKEPAKEEKNFWNPLRTEEDLEEALAQSELQKVVIFKHSTRCFISKTVLKNFEREVNKSDKKAAYYFLDLLANRGLSTKISEQFDIEHQSPQLIVLEKGKAINNASHHSISLDLV